MGTRERGTERPDPLARGVARLAAEVSACRACPRLVEWREEVAREKRASFSHEDYWGRPVPGFGDPAAKVLILGLAPAAHGANRTGRMFTGDRSGDFLYASLHRTGFANQPASDRLGDGLALADAYVTAGVRCAPPANRPTPAERDTCFPFLERELALLSHVRVVVALGQFAYDVAARLLAAVGADLGRPRPRFSHGAVVAATPAVAGGRAPTVVCSFHPSQQNTFTGRLTPEMLDAVFTLARTHAGLPEFRPEAG